MKLRMNHQFDWETVATVAILTLLLASIIIYSTYLEGKVATLEVRVDDLEVLCNKRLVKLDQKVTRLLKAAGVWR